MLAAVAPPVPPGCDPSYDKRGQALLNARHNALPAVTTSPPWSDSRLVEAAAPRLIASSCAMHVQSVDSL